MTDTKSLLEFAITLLTKNGKPMKMSQILKRIMTKFDFTQAEMDELAPQFILDFMTSGFFWFCEHDTWDLKERRPLSEIENDSFTTTTEEDEEAIENELRDENEDKDEDEESNEEDDDDNDDDDEDEEDDIEKELEEEKDDIELELAKSE